MKLFNSEKARDIMICMLIDSGMTSVSAAQGFYVDTITDVNLDLESNIYLQTLKDCFERLQTCQLLFEQRTPDLTA